MGLRKTLNNRSLIGTGAFLENAGGDDDDEKNIKCCCWSIPKDDIPLFRMTERAGLPRGREGFGHFHSKQRQRCVQRRGTGAGTLGMPFR